MFKELDPLLHSQLRLAVISILASAEQADFNCLKQETGASSGNLSIQLNKLKEAGYISMKKRFRGNYPQTVCRITPVGLERFAAYIDTLQEYLRDPGRN